MEQDGATTESRRQQAAKYKLHFNSLRLGLLLGVDNVSLSTV